MKEILIKLNAPMHVVEIKELIDHAEQLEQENKKLVKENAQLKKYKKRCVAYVDSEVIKIN